MLRNGAAENGERMTIEQAARKYPKLTSSLAAFLALGLASAAAAQDQGVIYAGGSAGDGAGGYAGGMIALPGNSLGHGLGIRAGVNGGTYRYQAAQRTKARYLGAELALVYQLSGQWGWANFAAGPRIVDTHLNPVDPGNKLRGTRLDAGLQTDGALGNEWRLGWFGSWGIRNESYLAQLRVTRLVDPSSQVRIGLEGIYQGDPTYKRGSLGAHIAFRLSGPWEAQLSAGASEQAGRDAKPYVSVGFSRVF